MKNICSLLTFIFTCFIVSAGYAQSQSYSDELFWATSKLNKDSLRIGFHDRGMVQVRLNYFQNSNAVTNNFFNKLAYRKTFIEEEDKEDVFNRLKASNRLGVDLSSAVSGYLRSSKDTTLLVELGVGYRELTYAKFTGDVFKLAFRGNSQFAGQDAKVGPSALKQWTYASLFVGVQKVVSKQLVLGTRLSLHRVGVYRETKLKSGNLYTHPDGDYVELSAPFEWHFQERGSDPFARNNGWGAGIDLFAQYWFKKSVLSVEVKDLGVMQLNNVATYKSTQTYRYDGVFINDILAPGNSFITSVELDSIAQKLGIEKEVKSRTVMLPTRLQLSYLHTLSNKWSAKADVNYMFLPGYLPFARIAGYYEVLPKIYIVPAVIMGGFGKVNSQLGLSATFAKTWSLQTSVCALEYLIAPNTYSGHGLELYLTKTF